MRREDLFGFTTNQERNQAVQFDRQVELDLIDLDNDIMHEADPPTSGIEALSILSRFWKNGIDVGSADFYNLNKEPINEALKGLEYWIRISFFKNRLSALADASRSKKLKPVHVYLMEGKYSTPDQLPQEGIEEIFKFRAPDLELTTQNAILLGQHDLLKGLQQDEIPLTNYPQLLRNGQLRRYSTIHNSILEAPTRIKGITAQYLTDRTHKPGIIPNPDISIIVNPI